MANDKKAGPARIPSGIKKLATSLQGNIERLYQTTYFSKPTNQNDLSTIKINIDKSIDNIITNNLNNVGIPNISKLYSRLFDTQTDSSVSSAIIDMFDDKLMMENILTSYMQNRYLKDLDNEIDVVCKYMPKLLEALDTRKDNVLSADHFSKDFINISNNSNITTNASFGERVDDMKERYDLAELFENAYDNAAKYGEQFIYIVPYKKAMSKLMASKAGTTMSKVQMENGVIVEQLNVDYKNYIAKIDMKNGTIVCESAKPYQMGKPDGDLTSMISDSSLNINIELNQSNMIDSVVQEVANARRKYVRICESSVSSFDEASVDKSLTGDLSYKDFEKSDAMDGLIDTSEKVATKNKITIPGCIVKVIDRCNIIPIYIEDLCLGYYYLEFKEKDEFSSTMSLTDPVMGMKTNSKVMTQSDTLKQDQLLKYISGQLSSYIDSKFINANQDLRKEIYMILKHNDLYNTPSADKIKVTFLPPEDVEHIYFKKDKATNRGISDLARALLPAKLYSSLYVTNSLAIMTRGQDKRVYYVKQNIDTNISKVLLNTIDQIKKSNFGMRQIENMNHILNITGKFNDYIIPVGANGDSPVQFEVMQGQNVEIKTELMNILEEMAINSTDVPLELIQARQSIDYALQLTMTNSKFLRKVYNRQAKFQKYCSNIVTKLYNGEYETDELLTVMLPPPMFLNVTNTNQIMTNTNELVQAIVDMEMGDEEDPLKIIFTRRLKRHYLSSYLDMHNLELIKDASRHELTLKTNDATPAPEAGQ